MRLRLSPRARQDIVEIGRFLAERSPAGAMRVREAIRSAFEVITNHPRAGRKLAENLFRYSLPGLPYLIFYRLDEPAGAVDVITVRHAARATEFAT